MKEMKSRIVEYGKNKIDFLNKEFRIKKVKTSMFNCLLYDNYLLEILQNYVNL